MTATELPLTFIEEIHIAPPAVACLAVGCGADPPASAIEPLQWVAAEIDNCAEGDAKRELLGLLLAAGGSVREEQLWRVFTSPQIDGGCQLCAGCWVLGANCVLCAVCCVLGAGCWVLAGGCWL